MRRKEVRGLLDFLNALAPADPARRGVEQALDRLARADGVAEADLPWLHARTFSQTNWLVVYQALARGDDDAKLRKLLGDLKAK